jgi:DNA-binding XRE family transcriptional regulator
MSAAVKMLHTEITIRHENETIKFKFPIEAGRGLLNFLNGLKNSNEYSRSVYQAEEVFPNIKDPLKRIGIIFRGIRIKNDLTQVEMAERLALDQSDISKIEKGKRPIGKTLAKKIEKEFSVDYRRFL